MMNFALLGMLAVVTTFVLLEWQRVLDREIRWELYRLRDELRMMAIEDRSLLVSGLFWRLDRSLTGYCAALEDLSLWVIVPLSVFKKREIAAESRNLQAQLQAPENAELAVLYSESTKLLLKHLVIRHWPLILLTVVGIVPFVIAYKRSSEKITATLLRPRLGESLMHGQEIRVAV